MIHVESVLISVGNIHRCIVGKGLLIGDSLESVEIFTPVEHQGEEGSITETGGDILTILVNHKIAVVLYE